MKSGKASWVVTLQLSEAPLETTPRVYLHSQKQHQGKKASPGYSGLNGGLQGTESASDTRTWEWGLT